MNCLEIDALDNSLNSLISVKTILYAFSQQFFEESNINLGVTMDFLETEINNVCNSLQEIITAKEKAHKE